MRKVNPKKTASKTRMTISNAAAHLNVTTRSIYNMIADKRLKTVDVDGVTFVKFKKEVDNIAVHKNS